MRCTCQGCGAYMVQAEKGLESHCVCPECFLTCAACLGTPEGPASEDALLRLMQRMVAQQQLDEANEDERETE